ncbi:MAG: 3-phosphoserine/phosphohydroxythreonine transaminase [Firmicutes bacterium]|nr:3-phosphoserine/phosphohydroxythreonine transaminase [Bacillota bacterium]MDD7601386.1 3-phosphoserine/phosphohydroxythreonine transaminase [Bacillota bacterium]MDY5857189.1 3-phosphoserine/phosphohydroxythreonine transaminase [Anaerovoracaceae bacterium]
MSKYGRVYNFSAGPSVLPVEVLEKVQKELLNYEGSGQSVMEMSHRSKEYKKIIDEAEANLRELMHIPDNYKVLFVQGGGTLQFAMVPMNLLRSSGKADYVITGTWAKKACKEATKFGDIRVIASSEEDKFTWVPKITREDIRSDADYAYIVTNNTIYGTRFNYIPDTGDIPLVADMSSNILSEEIDVSKFGLIWAGAQKNVAPAGVSIVIIREDLIGYASAEIPTYLDYKIHADNGSMYNTPPTFTIYVAGEVFKYLKSIGGIAEMEKRNKEKAAILYDCIDSSELFNCPVAKEDRSIMNVVFMTGDAELDKKFIAEAREKGMINLAGHRSLGGMRASIYNAMPKEGVEALVAFMKEFEAANK